MLEDYSLSSLTQFINSPLGRQLRDEMAQCGSHAEFVPFFFPPTWLMDD
jgi:hypothetical protein